MELPLIANKTIKNLKISYTAAVRFHSIGVPIQAQHMAFKATVRHHSLLDQQQQRPCAQVRGQASLTASITSHSLRGRNFDSDFGSDYHYRSNARTISIPEAPPQAARFPLFRHAKYRSILVVHGH